MIWFSVRGPLGKAAYVKQNMKGSAQRKRGNHRGPPGRMSSFQGFKWPGAVPANEMAPGRSVANYHFAY